MRLRRRVGCDIDITFVRKVQWLYAMLQKKSADQQKVYRRKAQKMVKVYQGMARKKKIAKDPDYVRRQSEQKRKFGRRGLRMQQLRELLDKQGGVCAICADKISVEIEADTKRATACIDHDHETGAFRGLLCHKCNAGIGMFKDNISRLELAKMYLRDWDKRKSDKDFEAIKVTRKQIDRIVVRIHVSTRTHGALRN